MNLPVRKPKRKMEEKEAATAMEESSASEEGNHSESVPVENVNGEVRPNEPAEGESEEPKPPIIKKPRKDIAEAAAKAAAEEEKEKTAEAAVAEEVKEQTADAEAQSIAEGEIVAVETEENVEGEAKESEAATELIVEAQEASVDVQAAPQEEPVPVDGEGEVAVVALKQEENPELEKPLPTPIYKDDEYEEPDDGAEIPEDPDDVWNQRLVELLLYKHQYRTLHVQATYDQSLHSWVDCQRKLYRRHKRDPTMVSSLTQLRLTVLDAINFPFTLRGGAHWDRYYAKLQEFNKKHGHCLVPRMCEFAGLGDWVIDQRRQYKLMMQGKPSVLDPERQLKLEELGFVWIVRNRPEWNNRFKELLQYREKYGDTKVPQHYKEIFGLGKWVAKQREQYRLLQQGKHSFLTPDRLEKLNEAGFVWSVRKDGTEETDDLISSKKKEKVKAEATGEKEKKKAQGAQTTTTQGETQKVNEETVEATTEIKEESMQVVRV